MYVYRCHKVSDFFCVLFYIRKHDVAIWMIGNWLRLGVARMLFTPMLSFEFNNSDTYRNENGNNETLHLIKENNYDSQEEAYRKIRVATMGTLVILGTIGNGLTFVVMRLGSLRNVSTCFFMAMLAVADTGECGPIFLNSLWTTWVLFCGTTDTPVLDFWWRLPWVSKPGWIRRLHALAPACN